MAHASPDGEPGVPVHRCRFLEYVPCGLTALASHPLTPLLSSLSERGEVRIDRAEVWQEAITPVATLSSGSTAGLQGMCWVSSQCPTTSFLGASLLLSSLKGEVLSSQWATGGFKKEIDVAGGAVWCNAVFTITGRDRGINKAVVIPSDQKGYDGKKSVIGSLVAFGCEDGAIRIYHVPFGDVLSLTLLAVCPGVEGRVLSLAWHPALPVLYSGTHKGAIRGWDMTALAEKVVQLDAAANTHAHDDDDDEEAEGKGRRRGSAAADVLTFRSGVVSSDIAGEVPLTAILGRGALAGPRPLVRMQLESLSRHDTSVWSLAVTRDLLVVAGDSRGNVSVWDGRTGTPVMSQPLMRHEGDVLSVSVFEEQEVLAGPNDTIHQLIAPASILHVVSSGVDGKVSVSRRILASDGMEGSDRVDEGTGERWHLVGSHRGHTHDARAVLLMPMATNSTVASALAKVPVRTFGLSSSALRTPLCVLSAGADGLLVAQQLSLLSNALAHPRRLLPFALGRERNLLSFSPDTGMLAYYGPSTEGGVEVWGVERYTGTEKQGSIPTTTAAAPSSKRKREGDGSKMKLTDLLKPLRQRSTPGQHCHLLTIKPELLSDAAQASLGGVSASRASIPLFNPTCVALSASGEWLAYASSQGGPHSLSLVRLHTNEDEAVGKSVLPEFVSLPSTVEGALGSRIVSSLRFISFPASAGRAAGELLIATTTSALHVLLCSERPTGSTGATPMSGVKRARMEGIAGRPSPLAHYLYTLKLPSKALPAHAAAELTVTASAAPISIPGRTPRKGVPAVREVEEERGGEERGGEEEDAADTESLDDASTAHRKRARKRRGVATIQAKRAADLSAAMLEESSPHVFVSCLAAHLKTTADTPTCVLAAATNTNYVHIYSLSRTSASLVCTTPKFDHPIVSLTFVDIHAFGKEDAAGREPQLLVALRGGSLVLVHASNGHIAHTFTTVLQKAILTTWRQYARYTGSISAAMARSEKRTPPASKRPVEDKVDASAIVDDVDFWLDAPLHVTQVSPAQNMVTRLLVMGVHYAATVTITPAATATSELPVITCTIHPFRYSNVIFAGALTPLPSKPVLSATTPSVGKVRSASTASIKGDTEAGGKVGEEKRGEGRGEVLVVELPWHQLNRHLTGALVRKRYGA
jgi:hypothetical protein